MVKLKSVHIEGFRSFRDTSVELGDLNVLIGANGSGKSNFIGFFNLLNYMFKSDEGLQRYVARHGGGSSVLHYGPKFAASLSASLRFTDGGSDRGYDLRAIWTPPDSLNLTEEHFLGDASPKATARNSPKRVNRVATSTGLESSIVEVSRGPHDDPATTTARVILKLLREITVYHFHDTSANAYIRRFEDVDRNRYLLSNGGNLASFLYMLQESKRAHFDRIIEVVRIVVPYLDRLILIPDKMNQDRILLRWQDRNPDYEFGPHQLSDGSLRAIALIVALLQPADFLPSVILIDEPELGLHPSATNVIASLIRDVSRKRQVIVSTQSPRFLAEFSPDETIVCERFEGTDGSGESRLRRLSNKDLATWLEEYDLGQLFEKNVTGGWPG